MSPPVNLPPAGSLELNQAAIIGNRQPDALAARFADGQPASESSLFTYTPCGCVWGLGSLILRGFRACVVGVATCIINCFSSRRPRRAPQPERAPPQPRIIPITVGEFLALVNRDEPRATPQELYTSFQRLIDPVREHIYLTIARTHHEEIDDIMERYRPEERKGVSLRDQNADRRKRAISEFIQSSPNHRTIIFALEELIFRPSEEEISQINAFLQLINRRQPKPTIDELTGGFQAISLRIRGYVHQGILEGRREDIRDIVDELSRARENLPLSENQLKEAAISQFIQKNPADGAIVGALQNIIRQRGR